VLVPDADGRRLLTAPGYVQSAEHRMGNADLLRSLLHHLDTDPLWLENMRDMYSESASYDTERSGGKTGLTTIEASCEGGILVSGDVKWKLYPPWMNIAREAAVKKWEALAKVQIHQCGSAPEGTMTMGDITYNVASDRRTNGWKSGDGCGLFTHSFSLWRMLGRLIRNYGVVTVTKTRQVHERSLEHPGKWILERQPSPGSTAREYMVEGKDATFTVEVRNNNTWGNFQISDGLYVYNSNRFYDDNKEGNIRNRWCIIPPNVLGQDELYAEVFSRAELDLI
jgi:hypothetical protein